MNILITTIVTSNSPNGLIRYIQGLLDGLQELNNCNNIYYILVNKELDESIKLRHKNFKKIKVSIPFYPRIVMRPLYFLWQNLFLNNIIKTYKIDLFHSPNSMPIFNTYGIPFIVTIHDIAEFSFKRHNSLKQWFRRYVAKKSAKIASAIITVSDFSRNEIERTLKANKNKVFVTHLASKIASNLKDEINIDTPFFLHVGGSKANKNIENIVEAFLKLNNKEYKLIFIGDTRELRYQVNQQRILNKNGIHFKGFVSESELETYYTNAFALVYPSLYEGFGLPIIEAMGVGLPVITSNTTSMPEISENAALLVEPTNVQSISNAMNLLIEDEYIRSGLILKGIERHKNFSWIKTAIETEKTYELIYNRRYFS